MDHVALNSLNPTLCDPHEPMDGGPHCQWQEEDGQQLSLFFLWYHIPVSDSCGSRNGKIDRGHGRPIVISIFDLIIDILFVILYAKDTEYGKCRQEYGLDQQPGKTGKNQKLVVFLMLLRIMMVVLIPIDGPDGRHAETGLSAHFFVLRCQSLLLHMPHPLLVFPTGMRQRRSLVGFQDAVPPSAQNQSHEPERHHHKGTGDQPLRIGRDRVISVSDRPKRRGRKVDAF
mmetsp:Transcript_9289/g.14892  ORF Transcript_9289/g.14892 Transcript_9289/m.14892 type:complete len:229 (+) Transcript_9289:351-1037(+)